jgi:hypothetical protein
VITWLDVVGELRDKGVRDDVRRFVMEMAERPRRYVLRADHVDAHGRTAFLCGVIGDEFLWFPRGRRRAQAFSLMAVAIAMPNRPVAARDLITEKRRDKVSSRVRDLLLDAIEPLERKCMPFGRALAHGMMVDGVGEAVTVRFVPQLAKADIAGGPVFQISEIDRRT